MVKRLCSVCVLVFALVLLFRGWVCFVFNLFGLPCLPCLACCLAGFAVWMFINSVDIMRLLMVELTRLLCCVLLSFRC